MDPQAVVNHPVCTDAASWGADPRRSIEASRRSSSRCFVAVVKLLWADLRARLPACLGSWYHPPLCLGAAGKWFLPANLFNRIVMEQAWAPQGMLCQCVIATASNPGAAYSFNSFNSPFGPKTDQQVGGQTPGATGRTRVKGLCSALGNADTVLMSKSLHMEWLISSYNLVHPPSVKLEIWAGVGGRITFSGAQISITEETCAAAFTRLVFGWGVQSTKLLLWDFRLCEILIGRVMSLKREAGCLS